MKDYAEMRLEVIKFMNSFGFTAYDLARITKDLCSCQTCVHYLQHYDREGKPVSFGHCIKGTPRSRRPDGASCGGWQLREDQEG